MNIGVVGQGFVGLSLSVFLASKKIQVFGVENNEEKLSVLKNGKSTFFEPKLNNVLQKCLEQKNLKFVNSLKPIFNKLDVVYICVPTPNKKSSINLTYIKNVISEIQKLLNHTTKKPLIVIKSTISPGTSKLLVNILSKNYKYILGENFYFAVNPEFLREGSAINDQFNPHILVIGTEEIKSKNKIQSIYKKLYSKQIPRIFTNFSSAELIKYTNNAFLATKISFINSISNLCEKIPGANVDDIAEAIGLDPRIGPYFLKAGPGFGGSCLPKDLISFIDVYKSFDVSPTLFNSVKNVNDKQLEQILKILENKFNKISGKTISILGLSFKENSDDIRESRSIKLIQNIIKKNCAINVFDSLALENTKQIFKNKLVYCTSVSECLKNSDCVIIMNSEKIFKQISKQNIETMRRQLIIDSRRIIEQKIREMPKTEYVALGVND
jgi:UDPglucose 6-dehydrogenase